MAQFDALRTARTSSTNRGHAEASEYVAARHCASRGGPTPIEAKQVEHMAALERRVGHALQPTPSTRSLCGILVAVCAHLIELNTAVAQTPTLCIPGTPFCTKASVAGGAQAGGAVRGQAEANGSGTRASVDENAHANASATTSAHANTGIGASGQVDANGSVHHEYGQVTGHADHPAEVSRRHYRRSVPMRFGSGVAFCGTLKAGVYSGWKAGPCFAVSFRTEPLTFEMETQLLFGGKRHTVDWVFPMSFVIPLTSQRSLYEGLQLRVGGSPIGVTFAKARNGGNYLRFGLHAGLSYEYSLGRAATWRVFDARSFLDFGTRREVDLRHNFTDFGGQLSTAIVF